MIKYTSTRQLSFEEFKTPFYHGLDKTNRWVVLAQHIPWDEFARIYASAMRDDFGRPALDARIVIGALIIKHTKGLSDGNTIEEIRENPYLQYFIGYEEFSHKPPFDPSLFVHLRERIGVDAFEKLNEAFLKKVDIVTDTDKSAPGDTEKDDNDSTGGGGGNKRQGTLILDATVAPQDIKYPTDLDLLNEGREQTERLIDELWQAGPGKRKPRTYRRTARKDYLAVAKKKRMSKKVLRSALRKQLNYIKRNIKTIMKMIEPELGKPVPLNRKDLRVFWIVQEVYRQQKQIYDSRTRSVSDRIVSITQPYVRPIVRGKSGKQTEFGAKLSVSLVDGYVYLDHLDWNAFNESKDLKKKKKKYKDRFGCYPAKVIGDKIYRTRENRRYLKEHQINLSGRPLGRPPKLTAKEARLLRQCERLDESLRVQIEGKFGEGKRKYGLDCVMTKTQLTSGSWIAAVFYIMNIARWLRTCSFLSLLRCLDFFKERIPCSPKMGWAVGY